MSRKPDPSTPSKYENQLPPYLQDFFNFQDVWEQNGELEQWQVNQVEDIRAAIVGRIQKHYKESSRARFLFANMNKDVVWENEAEKIMHITRRNIATFEVAFINELELFIRESNKAWIAPIREEILGISVAVLSSNDEQEAVRLFANGDTFFFEDISQHIVEQVAWQAELFNRYPLIQFIREWELFYLNLIKFEESNHNSSVQKVRVAAHNLNAKFRTLASQTVVETLQTLKQVIDEYQTTNQKAFEVKGVVYQHLMESQQRSVASVKTNFSAFSRSQLALLDSATDEIQPIVVSQLVTDLLQDEDRYSFIEFVDHSRGVFN